MQRCFDENQTINSDRVSELIKYIKIERAGNRIRLLSYYNKNFWDSNVWCKSIFVGIRNCNITIDLRKIIIRATKTCIMLP